MTTTDHKIKRSARIRTVRLADMRINPNAQRKPYQPHVQRLLAALDKDTDKVGVFTLSHRGDTYYILDGQHRYLALKELLGDDYGDWSVEAYAYEGLTEQEEAAKFLEFNSARPVSVFEKFRIGVEAGEQMPCDIDRIVRSIKLRISQSKDPGNIGAVAALEHVYRNGGPIQLVATLVPIRDAWGGLGFDSAIIRGMGSFVARYDGRIDQKKLVRQLSGLHTGPNGLTQLAYQQKEMYGVTLNDAVPAAITEVYNKGARGKASLGSWFKAVA